MLSGTVELPSRVKIVEVGPRDGLQNEKVETKSCAAAHFTVFLPFFLSQL